jgi:hypothetical protein
MDPSGQNWSDTDVLCRHVTTCRRHFQLRGGHPLPGDVTDDFADRVIDVIGKGVVTGVNMGGSLPKKQKGGDAVTGNWRSPQWRSEIDRLHYNNKLKFGETHQLHMSKGQGVDGRGPLEEELAAKFV